MNSKAPARQPVSIVIVNYNAGHILTQCVDKCIKQARQVIVIDNASSDTSITNLKACFPAENGLVIHCADHNQGFSAGCNLGYRQATEPYVFFLNPDCILDNNTVQKLVHELESDSDAGMAGGYLSNPDGSEQGGGRRNIPTPWRAMVRATGLYHLGKFWPQLFPDFHLHKQTLPDRPIEVEAISGAMMLVRREAIHEVGTWDENYFLHCEDLDWCMRFRQKGWKIKFVPDAKVTHYQGTCSKTRPLFVAWHKHKGMLYFYQKFFHEQYPGFLMGIIAAGVGLRFTATVLLYVYSRLTELIRFKHG